MNKFFSIARTERHFLSEWWWTVDRVLLAALIAMMMIGVVLVMAASPPVAERIGVTSMHFIIRHLITLGPVLALILGLSFMNERQIWRTATFVLAGGIVAMILVLFIGTEIKGAQRWLHLPGFSLQPSEFVKPALAVIAAWLIARQKEQPNFPGNILAGIVYFLVITLLLLQPDLGMTVIVTSIIAAQIFLAGLPFRYMAGFVLLGIFGLLLAYYSFDHVHSRIDRFLDPTRGDNYQIEQSINAFHNGGIIGTGPGQGTIKLRIPDAHADFIFSVGAEEFGLIFVYALIALYGFIIWRVIHHLVQAKSMFVILACGGLLTMFGLQAMVHMGSAMHLLPTKGMTLPFMSYGGSSLLSMGFSFGIVLALTRRSPKTSISRMGMSMNAAMETTTP